MAIAEGPGLVPPAPLGPLVPLVAVGGRAAYLLTDPADPGHLGDAGGDGGCVGDLAQVLDAARELEAERRPRWVVPEARHLAGLVAEGVPVARLWDIAEVHRLLVGGWSADLGTVAAHLDGLALDGIPRSGPEDLFTASAPTPPDERPDDPIGPDGYLRADALLPSWADSDERLLALCRLGARLALAQRERLGRLGPRALATAHAESAAALVCLELERDGLPVDRTAAESLVQECAGPRPRDEADAARIRAERDARVLAHVPGRVADLRNPAQVKALLAAAGVHVRSTRKWELEPLRESYPVVDALLRWRKDERIATTYGYRWLDEHVGPDGRLRGGWTACDGAAGRMTAQAGLHNLPVPLRAAVVAEPGHVFVRADLGQIEPRVLAAVSGDPAFAAATQADDLYAPVAAKLGVDRPVAKVAVLAAMYGQRSGAAGAALADLERAYPVAMRLLDQAYAAGLAARPVRTFGGRLVALDTALVPDRDADPATRAALDAARGRFARNAVIQGAAAELFKAWAATVRHEVAPVGGRIVLALHDELLVHVPEEHARAAMGRVERALQDAARRWLGSEAVRFVADVSVVRCWADAKG